MIAEAPGGASSKSKVSLEDAVDILDSKRVPVNSDERSRRAGSVPYYGATGQVGWIDDFLFNEELVLLGEDGAPFLDAAKPKAYMIRGKSWVNNHAHVLRAKAGLSNAYLMHQLNALDFAPYVSGTTRLKLPQGQMKQMRLLVPPFEEQLCVVSKIDEQFSRLDAGVAALRRAQANLKRYRASVLKAACEGRLVPTEAELARREGRTYETGKELLDRILEKRRGVWKGSGKYAEPKGPETDGDFLPEGWVRASAEQLTSVITDGEHITPRRSDSGVLLLSARNVLDGRLSFDKVDFVPKEEYDRISKRLTLEPGDVLLSCSGSVGRSTVVPAGILLTLVRSVAVLKPLVASGKFMSICIQSQSMQRQIKSKQTQTAQANIFQGKIKTLSFAIPPLAEQERIVLEIERLFSIVDQLNAVITSNLLRATGLRKSVLRAAFAPKVSL